MNNLKLNVLELRPKNPPSNAVCIVDTDLTVEFAPPLDGSHEKIVSQFYKRALVSGDNIDDTVKMGQFKYYRMKLIHDLDDDGS